MASLVVGVGVAVSLVVPLTSEVEVEAFFGGMMANGKRGGGACLRRFFFLDCTFKYVFKTLEV